MKDPRSQKLAELLIQYSTKLQPGEKVLIDCIGDCADLCKDIIEEAYKAGGIPFINVENPVLNAAILKQAPAEAFTLQRKWEELRMNEMDAYIGVRATNNSYTMKSIPAKQHELHSTLLWEPVHGQIRVPKTKWVILRYPNDSMAQLAEMSTEEFEDYYFNVCTVDYKKMSESMDPLVELMEKYPNLYMDITPALDIFEDLSAQPEKAKAFFEKYEDRIFYGTDAWSDLLTNEEHRRYNEKKVKVVRHFLCEEEDEVIDGQFTAGLGLSKEQQEKIYYHNCLKFIKRI